MHKRQIISAAILLAGPWTALADVTVQVDASAAGPQAHHAVGATIVCPLTVAGDGVGVMAVELDLACTTDDLRLRAVTFAPAFGQTLRDATDDLPAAHCQTAAGQPVATLDPALAADGPPVPLATVELEVLRPGPWRSALEIKAQAASMGTPQPRTVVQLAAPPATDSETASLSSSCRSQENASKARPSRIHAY